MTKKNCIKPVTAVIGAALAGSLSAVNLANAADNPFATTQMQSGYMMLAEGSAAAEKTEEKTEEKKEAGEGKCGEGKCGGDKAKSEGKCGEGKCGGDKAKGEGKCGEGKCGGK